MRRVTTSQAMGKSTTTAGTPIRIQSRKLTSLPVASLYTPMKITFGGVPIGVPRPPMLAA